MKNKLSTTNVLVRVFKASLSSLNVTNSVSIINNHSLKPFIIIFSLTKTVSPLNMKRKNQHWLAFS